MTADSDAQPFSPPPPATSPASRPYDGLTPHEVLDALDAAGLRGDGRILQLNSYENRVFQVHLEDGRIVVAKFYRAGRWSDAQILEEHTFARELAEAEVPAVAPLTLTAETRDVALAAYFSDRGRPFQADRGRQIWVAVGSAGEARRNWFECS